jgi:tetratricopeptide (TPR) repeat protein
MIRKKNFSLLFLSVFLLSNSCVSQNSKWKVKKYLRKADIEIYNNNFKKALELYQQAYILDTNDVRSAFGLATCMYRINKYKRQSLPYFEKAKRGGIAESSYYLGNLYHLNMKFDEAINAFEEYKKITGKKNFSNQEIDFLIGKCKTAKEFVKSPVNVTIENLGSTINSPYPDYVPVISADESILIFTSRRKGSTGNQLDPLGEYFEDVYISEKKDGQWTSPKSISKNINTPTHDACVGLSADGELLFLYRTSRDLLSGDLYISVFDGKDWTVPEKLPEPINTKEYTEPSASLSADGQAIYFSSNRPGGYGKKDIYKVVKLPNGEWSKAFNMGPTINTSEDEDAPFIHPNGRILYFSSKGHKNIGGYDIFKTIFSQQGVWSEPENLGYPINTTDDDIYFVLSTDGKRGYYSSVRPDSYGSSDIYMIRFPDEELNLKVCKGKVVSADSAAQPLAAKITLFNSKTNKVEGIYNTNQLTGKFIMIISPNKEYNIRIESKGYVSYSKDLLQPVSDEKIEIIKLYKMEK